MAGPRKSVAPGASMVPKAAPKAPQAKAAARAVPGDDSDVDAWQDIFDVRKMVRCQGKFLYKHSSNLLQQGEDWLFTASIHSLFHFGICLLLFNFSNGPNCPNCFGHCNFLGRLCRDQAANQKPKGWWVKDLLILLGIGAKMTVVFPSYKRIHYS